MKVIKLKKFGTTLSIFLLANLGFVGGSLMQVNAADSSTVLPITRGGTAKSNFTSNNALIYKNNQIGVLPIDTYPTQNSQNLITSGGANTFFQKSSQTPASAINFTAEFPTLIYPKVAKYGGLAVIAGAIHVRTEILPNTTYEVGTLQPGWKSASHHSMAIPCNGNFTNADFNQLAGYISCVLVRNTLFMRSTEYTSLDTSRYFLLNLIYITEHFTEN
ncbi:MAG: hypothetical protein LBT91_03200 [Bifidobacteriaceae bacterium]|jgi:hypothetical protein|nr:hypothetical protein [Bifidobacteriaceae bacterium]